MDAKFLSLTAVLATVTFGAVWMATAPAGSGAAAPLTEPARDTQPAAAPARPHYVVEAPPEDVEPDSAFAESAPRAPRSATATRTDVYFRNCREAWAAGAAPIYRGEPGYRPEMDGDSDGIACEPFHGR